jgi:NADP-dependent 3-hydroxy acid dehydrogenase YdfG
MSHAADHPTRHLPSHSMTRRHHRKSDRAVVFTVPRFVFSYDSILILPVRNLVSPTCAADTPGMIYGMTKPVLLIVGASTGIGAATARLATKQGWRIAIAARSEDALTALAAELGTVRSVQVIPCDISEWDQVRQLPVQVIKNFGRLDAVFANAGYSMRTSFLHGTGTPEQWRQMVLTNVYGTALVARATLPVLAKFKGHLLLTGSVAGRVTIPGQLYSATKWAVTAIAQSIRAEVTSTGIRVTLIQPGLVDTGRISPARQADPRLEPDAIARAVLFALEQPATVDVSEIVIRPTGQDSWR